MTVRRTLSVACLFFLITTPLFAPSEDEIRRGALANMASQLASGLPLHTIIYLSPDRERARRLIQNREGFDGGHPSDRPFLAAVNEFLQQHLTTYLAGRPSFANVKQLFEELITPNNAAPLTWNFWFLEPIMQYLRANAPTAREYSDIFCTYADTVGLIRQSRMLGRRALTPEVVTAEIRRWIDGFQQRFPRTDTTGTSPPAFARHLLDQIGPERSRPFATAVLALAPALPPDVRMMTLASLWDKIDRSQMPQQTKNSQKKSTEDQILRVFAERPELAQRYAARSGFWRGIGYWLTGGLVGCNAVNALTTRLARDALHTPSP